METTFINIFMLCCLNGPVDNLPNRPTIYIYTDINSKNNDEARKSKIVQAELGAKLGDGYLDSERLYIYTTYNIIVLDYDNEYEWMRKLKIKRFPCMRYGKNGYLEYFPKYMNYKRATTFAASGSFIFTLINVLKYMQYEEDIEEYSRKERKLMEAWQELWDDSAFKYFQFIKPKPPKEPKIEMEQQEDDD